MFFLIKYYDEISCLHVGLLVPLSAEDDLLSVSHAFVHVHLKDFTLTHRFTAL